VRRVGQESVMRIRSLCNPRSPVRSTGHLSRSRRSTRRSAMFKLKTVLASAVTATVLATGTSAALADGMKYTSTTSQAPAAKGDIIDTAVGAGQFTTLAKALTAAGLIDTLKGAGPFTVFAPTDAAFAKIPPAQLNALLADKAALTKVLTYHVVPGEIVAADVKTGQVKTVEGQFLTVTASSMGVKINDANVIKTDVMASNGVIHVIDTVVLPN
jgi:uncharacterized surface protein with fasciclin (FAS1) repeats